MNLQHVALCIIFLFASEAYAEKSPFTWPKSYALTITETNKTHSDEPFVNVTHTDGLNVRNQIISPDSKAKIIIFQRMRGNKKIEITPDGSIQETTLPADWPTSNIFPKDGKWELLGNDTIDGKPAHKYKVTRNATLAGQAPYVAAWLSADGKTPLRMEDGDTILKFSDYAVGPQDTKLFETPKK